MRSRQTGKSGVAPEGCNSTWFPLQGPREGRAAPTYGTPFTGLLIAQGKSLAYLRDELGHASIQLTVDACGVPEFPVRELPTLGAT